MSPTRRAARRARARSLALTLAPCVFWALAGAEGRAQPAPPAPPAPPTSLAQPAPPPIERLSEHALRVGAVTLNRQTQELEVPARVNMTQGILEYYGVASNGKLHEAVLEVLAEPSHLHLALLLAGYEPSEFGPREPETDRRALKRRGSLLKLYLKWTPPELGREQWLPSSAWLFNRASKSPPRPMPYVFQGSLFGRDGRYVADLERSVVGLIEDSTAVLSPTSDTGNPYRGDELGLEVYTAALPPKGTSVTLVLRPASHQDEKELEEYIAELKRINELRERFEAERAAREGRSLPRPEFDLTALPTSASELEYGEPPAR